MARRVVPRAMNFTALMKFCVAQPTYIYLKFGGVCVYMWNPTLYSVDSHTFCVSFYAGVYQ